MLSREDFRVLQRGNVSEVREVLNNIPTVDFDTAAAVAVLVNLVERIEELQEENKSLREETKELRNALDRLL